MSVISFEEARKKQEQASTSDVELTQSTVSEAIGQQPTEEDAIALKTLAKAHFEGFTTKSDYAREHADIVAMLACCNLITTHVQDNEWSSLWKITAPGLTFLEELLRGDYEEE